MRLLHKHELHRNQVLFLTALNSATVLSGSLEDMVVVWSTNEEMKVFYVLDIVLSIISLPP